MNLTARREPTFHDGAQSGAKRESFSAAAADAPQATIHPALRSSRLTRLISTVQIVGSLLAVPLGLASGYSMYRANFAPETACQQLRSNIVLMLDKNVDAATRRMLVRRDIETFERSCGSVDPDAHAAFKLLLDAEPKAAAVPPKAPMKATVAAPPATVVRKVEAKAEVKTETKIETTAATRLETKPEAKPELKLSKFDAKLETKAEPDAALSDARWLEAVRQALVTHGPERADAADAAKEATVKPLRAEVPLATRAATPVLPSSWTPPAIPAMAQPAYVAPTRPQQVDADHPVPPASIPTPVPVNDANAAHDEERSRLGKFIAEIPLVGRVMKRGEN